MYKFDTNVYYDWGNVQFNRKGGMPLEGFELCHPPEGLVSIRMALLHEPFHGRNTARFVPSFPGVFMDSYHSIYPSLGLYL